MPSKLVPFSHTGISCMNTSVFILVELHPHQGNYTVLASQRKINFLHRKSLKR